MSELEEGINCYLAGDVNGAIKYLTAFTLRNATDSRAYYYLGLAYYDIGKNNDAGVYFSKALELDPDKGLYHYNLGLVYNQMMLFQQAIEHLTKAAQKNPEHIRARFILAGIYFKNGDLENAIKIYEDVITVSPHFAPAYYELGNSRYYMGDLESAKKAYLQAAELNSGPETLYKLGLVELELNNYNVSADYVGKAVEKGFENSPLLTGYLDKFPNGSEKDNLIKIIKEYIDEFCG